MEYAPLWLGGFCFGNVGFDHLHSVSALGLQPLTNCFGFRALTTYIVLPLRGFGHLHKVFTLGLRPLLQCFLFKASWASAWVMGSFLSLDFKAWASFQALILRRGLFFSLGFEAWASFRASILSCGFFFYLNFEAWASSRALVLRRGLLLKPRFWGMEFFLSFDFEVCVFSGASILMCGLIFETRFWDFWTSSQASMLKQRLLLEPLFQNVGFFCASIVRYNNSLPSLCVIIYVMREHLILKSNILMWYVHCLTW